MILLDVLFIECNIERICVVIVNYDNQIVRLVEEIIVKNFSVEVVMIVFVFLIVLIGVF